MTKNVISETLDKINKNPFWVMTASLLGLFLGFYGIYLSYRSLHEGLTTNDLQGLERDVAVIKTEVTEQPHTSAVQLSIQPPQISTAQLDQKLRDLRAAADQWNRRRSDQAPNILPTLNAITEDDRAKFSPLDKTAWNTLKDAETLLDWTQKGFNAETARSVPMGVDRDNTQDLSDRAAGILADRLRNDGFHVTDKNFAIVLSVTNASQEEALSPQNGSKRAAWTVTTRLHLKASWIGEAPALYDGYVEGVAQGDKDQARLASVESASQEALSRLKTLIQ